MRYRRITAAILDILILIFIASFVFNIMPLNEKIENNYSEIGKIESKGYSNLTEEDKKTVNDLSYEVEREMVKSYLIFSGVLIVYFIVIPFKFKNQTFGQRIRKVRLVSYEAITMNTYTIRAVLNSGLILMIFFPLFIYILNAVWYPIFAAIIFLLQILYWIVNIFMLLITKSTIHDRITKTKVIEVKR